MLKIYVCEDDDRQKAKIVKIIKNYLMMQDCDVAFEWAGTDPYILLSYLEEHSDGPSLFFLDVDFKTEMNGISLGSEIRKRNFEARIVFITTHMELSYLTFLYKVEAMDYISKDDESMLATRISNCIDVAVERYLGQNSEKNDSILIQSEGVSIKLSMSEILFIESSTTPHRLLVHLDNRQVKYYGKIKDVEKLNPLFYRCHQSFVVNVNNIEEVDRKNRVIKMNNGEICYVSVRYLKSLLKRIEID